MQLRNILFTFIIALFSLLSFTPHVAFASCAPAVSLAEYKEQADIVVLGRVTSIADTPAIFNVERYFKGHGGPSQIEVSGQEAPGTVTSVDFAFEEDKKYLLFLKMDSGNLKTNACMGNKEVTGNLSEEDRAVLGSGYSPNGYTQDLSSSQTSETVEKSVNTNMLLPIIGGALGLGLVAFVLKKRKRKSSR